MPAFFRNCLFFNPKQIFLLLSKQFLSLANLIACIIIDKGAKSKNKQSIKDFSGDAKFIVYCSLTSLKNPNKYLLFTFRYLILSRPKDTIILFFFLEVKTSICCGNCSVKP